ncbi:SRPBCC family protein [Fredinandcohnia onubensis]|uniref:SRPBCC family protein n=1 Tax=Fredinandcohnia onubensis TaxID=1571209 RepID=UPI000C0BD090|nr:SRPBCC family protein [Fredinandcohnia onubensis]
MISEITSKMRIDKSTSEVFEALVDPEKIGNYWFSNSSGRLEEGKKITWLYQEYNAELTIKVVEVEQDKRIVYKWGEGEYETTVTFLLVEEKNGSTVLEVTESGFNTNDPEIVNILLGQKEGWMYMLACLKGYLENGISTLRGSLIH